MGNVREVSGKELSELRAAGKKIVCDFWAAWCGPCRMLGPVLDKIAAEFQGKAEFVKVNIDEEGETAVELGIFSIPDVYVFDGERVVNHSLGFVPEAELRRFLQENL